MNWVCHVALIIEAATERIVVDVGGLDPCEVSSHRPAKQGNLNRRKDELKEEEDGIAVDPRKVLPGQSEDVVGMRDVAVWICGAPAGVGGRRHPRHWRRGKKKV